MSKQCDICGKKPLKANKVCFSNKHHAYRQEPNLQPVKIMIDRTAKKVKVCTSCIKAGKAKRTV